MPGPIQSITTFPARLSTQNFGSLFKNLRDGAEALNSLTLQRADAKHDSGSSSGWPLPLTARWWKYLFRTGIVVIMTDVTHLLSQIEAGDRSAAEELLPLVYAELRKLAAAMLANEKPGQTLQPTALVHEAYLRLVDADQVQRWDSHRHFFSAAAESMRRILVEKARRKARLKRGGKMHRSPLEDVELSVATPQLDLLVLDEALTRLAAESPEKAEVVRLRFFAGLSHEEVAEILGVSTVTIKRHWRYARVWLLRQMDQEPDSPGE